MKHYVVKIKFPISVDSDDEFEIEREIMRQLSDAVEADEPLPYDLEESEEESDSDDEEFL